MKEEKNREGNIHYESLKDVQLPLSPLPRPPLPAPPTPRSHLLITVVQKSSLSSHISGAISYFCFRFTLAAGTHTQRYSCTRIQRFLFRTLKAVSHFGPPFLLRLLLLQRPLFFFVFFCSGLEIYNRNTADRFTSYASTVEHVLR